MVKPAGHQNKLAFLILDTLSLQAGFAVFVTMTLQQFNLKNISNAVVFHAFVWYSIDGMVIQIK